MIAGFRCDNFTRKRRYCIRFSPTRAGPFLGDVVNSIGFAAPGGITFHNNSD